MVLRDRQRLEKIAEYCEDILAAVARYGSSYDTFQSDRDFQHSVSFCILQIGELVHMAAANDRWCGAKRPQCGAKRSVMQRELQ